ncbi:hypothetical protein DAPPUDRAFT_325606 [Daphnia pulex]|uniref:PiggyBac transposable element-derived protein 4 C-terminal zinc-ribbon domain-containing protein n=1 Tax=Daphnia pulex TaxID=6669 RepID=E9H590_DAPPU|nr:hypothetical protein DAPPUDRAFT_325606 [Daphnia pulex]|eukprot:EFX73118.1 hypothetical protein DAPPUDRAFT_325606 [Daphnia pulex]
MEKNKKRDPRYIKSRAVKNSAKKAAAAAVLKRQQLKEAKEREAGNKVPSIDTDTGHEAQNNVEESVASEEPVEEPGQELEPEREPVLDQGPADEEEPIAEKERETANEEPPVKAKTVVNLKKVTVRLERLAFNPNDDEKQERKNLWSLLEFKRIVTTSLLFYGLNAEKARKEDAPEARLMKEIPLSAEPGAKRRKDRLSVPDEIRFSQVGIHHPIFVENRGRCEWCQATTERRPNGHTKESRPFSQCSMCKIFLCLSKKRNCFLEFHDDRILDPTKAAAETVLAVDPEEEIAVQTVETDPLGIYPSSDSSDDSDFDALNNDVNDGVLLDEDEWVK